MTYAYSAAMSPDGRFVAAGDGNGILRIWDFRSGRLLRRWKAQGDMRGLWSVVFTSDGKGLLGGGGDKSLRLWDISSLVAGQSGSRRGALVSGVTDEGDESLVFCGHTVRHFVNIIYHEPLFPLIGNHFFCFLFPWQSMGYFWFW
jgi:WD40 repeat protein